MEDFDSMTTDDTTRKAHRDRAEDEYFDSRPAIDCNDRRRVFQAGFDRGWGAAREHVETIDELRDLRAWREKAFEAHPNLNMDIEAMSRCPAAHLCDCQEAGQPCARSMRHTAE